MPSFCDNLSNSWWGRGREGMRWDEEWVEEWGDGVCVCVEGTEQFRERQTESVCLDQLHSKSVYSAQFGIKHNRLLSACYCLWCPWWCPIKMEFIAALRASPNYIFPSALRPPSLSFALFLLSWQWWWLWCRVFFVLTSSSGCQTSRQNGSLQTPNGQYGWHAHLPVSTSLLSPLSPEWAARINHVEDSWHTSWMWWHLMQLSLSIPTNLQMLKEFLVFHSFTFHSQASHLVKKWRRKKTFLSFAGSTCYVAIFRQFNVTSLFQLHPDDRQK